jgi:hypothetical protein
MLGDGGFPLEKRPLRTATPVLVVAVLAATALLLFLSLLGPVAASPPRDELATTPTSAVYLPYAAREILTTPTATSVPEVDLRVWDIVNSPRTPTLGQTIRITVSVQNQGVDDAPAATLVRLTVDDQWVPPDVLVPPLPSMAIARSVWGVSSGSLGVGSHSMRGEVDITDAVSETNESNNTLQDSFQIVSPSQ